MQASKYEFQSLAAAKSGKYEKSESLRSTPTLQMVENIQSQIQTQKKDFIENQVVESNQE